MTEASPGPGWWQASDGRWYPPHLHPRARSDEAQSPDGGTTLTGTTLAEAPESREPIDWERVAAERAQRRKREETKRRLRIGAAVVVALAVLLGLYLFARDDDGDDTATTAGPDLEATVAPQSTTVATTAPPSSEPEPTTAPTEAPATVAPTEAPTTAAPGPTGATPVSVFDVQPGTCIDNAGLTTGLVTDLQAVPCEQPHTHEVFHKVTYLPDDGAYDASRIATFANEQCALAFAEYVGVSYDRSMYYFLHLAPSQQSWNDQGDRDVVCLLFLQGTTMTGSAKGTAR